MRKPAVDVRRLADFLAERLRIVALELSPLDVKCAWPVFRGTAVGRPPVFVKVTDRAAAERTLAFLRTAAAGCDLLPRPVLDDAPEFAGHAVLCLEWRTARTVNAEDMTDAQLAGFLAGCRTLSRALAAYRGEVVAAAEDSPEAQHAALAGYAARHPLAGRLLRPLVDIPEAERSYRGHELVTIHGDLQPKNYGFDGDRLAAVFDTDDLARGLACEDAAYAFTERARRSELSAEKRRRLTALFRKAVAESPWPRGEWLIAVNHARLRIASRRLANHPDSPFIGFDIARRDRPLRDLAEALRLTDMAGRGEIRAESVSRGTAAH